MVEWRGGESERERQKGVSERWLCVDEMLVSDFAYASHTSAALGCEADDDVKRAVVYGVG